MNIRSLTRGDGAVIGAALLLLIASFLPFFSVDGKCESGGGVDCDANAWGSATMPMLGAVHLAAVIAAVLIVVGRSLPADRKLGGLSFDQWGVALSVFVAWSSIFSMFGSAFDVFGAVDAQGGEYELGIGAYLTLLFGLAIGVSAVLGAQLPALKAPLLAGPRPQQPGMGMPGVQQPGGYGYPGAQPQQPQQPGQPGGYGYPGPSGGGAPAGFGGGAPAPAPQPAAPSAGGGDFTPFWFAVPVSRPLFGEDGSPSPIAELTPGTWYLAVEQRGQALIAQTQDGRRGVLQDTSGIQRG